jgi:hypothetical protein
MRKTLFVVLAALVVIASAACKDNLTGPSAVSRASASTASNESAATLKFTDFVGTWQATKAEGWRVVEEGDGFAEVVGSRRDLVAEGGTVTLVLEGTPVDWPNGPLYTITVTMPGTKPGVDTGRWCYNEFSIETGHSKYPQIDFYPSSLGPEPEYGEIPAFLVALSGNTMKLWEGGGAFLPFDFGWNAPPGKNRPELNFEFTRK